MFLNTLLPLRFRSLPRLSVLQLRVVLFHIQRQVLELSPSLVLQVADVRLPRDWQHLNAESVHKVVMKGVQLGALSLDGEGTIGVRLLLPEDAEQYSKVSHLERVVADQSSKAKKAGD